MGTPGVYTWTQIKMIYTDQEMGQGEWRKTSQHSELLLDSNPSVPQRTGENGKQELPLFPCPLQDWEPAQEAGPQC